MPDEQRHSGPPPGGFAIIELLAVLFFIACLTALMLLQVWQGRTPNNNGDAAATRTLQAMTSSLEMYPAPERDAMPSATTPQVLGLPRSSSRMAADRPSPEEEPRRTTSNPGLSR